MNNMMKPLMELAKWVASNYHFNNLPLVNSLTLKTGSIVHNKSNYYNRFFFQTWDSNIAKLSHKEFFLDHRSILGLLKIMSKSKQKISCCSSVAALKPGLLCWLDRDLFLVSTIIHLWMRSSWHSFIAFLFTCRTTASTNMNDTSSRSHAIFTISFTQVNQVTNSRFLALRGTLLSTQ